MFRFNAKTAMSTKREFFRRCAALAGAAVLPMPFSYFLTFPSGVMLKPSGRPSGVLGTQ